MKNKDISDIKAFIEQVRDTVMKILKKEKKPDFEMLCILNEIAGEMGKSEVDNFLLIRVLEHTSEILKNISSIEEDGITGAPAITLYKALNSTSALLMLQNYHSNKEVVSWFFSNPNNMKYLQQAIQDLDINMPAWELFSYAEAVYSRQIFIKLIEQSLR